MALALSGIPSLLPSNPSKFQCEHYKVAFSLNPSRKFTRRSCIHCSAKSDSSPGSESWAHPPDAGRGDSFQGWSFLDGNNKRNTFSGLLKVGAGIALAVGFALVSHACSKRGIGAVVVPAPSIYEETIVPKLTETQKLEEAVPEHHEPEVAEEPVLVEEHETVGEQQEQYVEEPVHSSREESPGQVSLLSDTAEEVSGDGVVSSSASSGAASTFGIENGGEEHAEGESGSKTDELAEEDSSSPASAEEESANKADELGGELSSSPEDLTDEVVSDGLKADATDETSPVSDLTAVSNEDISSSTGDSEKAREENPSESFLADLSVSSQELPVVSEVPIDGDLVLVASVIDAAEETEVSKVQSESDKEVEVVMTVTASLAPSANLEDKLSSPSKVGASPVEKAAELNAPETDDPSRVATIDSLSPSSETELWEFTSVVMPAPCAPSALASGRVLIPPVVDHGQEQAVSALQSLKVVEPGVGAAEICTRREYARWLVAANRTLAKNTAAKVLPAMYIEKITEIAFDDVSPNDPDFPFIQGLAEAGIISSKLSLDEASDESVNFLPDRPLSRQDLISWKLTLDHHSLPIVNRNRLQEKTGFIDIDHIHKDAWPSIAADISTGDRSIIASAFGYTRRFQPHKPVTTGQAAVALVSGDASEQVSEELERLEAEKLAEKAVADEIALEARAQKEASLFFQEELEQQRQLTAAAEALVQSLSAELEQLKSEREIEKLSTLKERASLEAAKDTLSQARLEIDGRFQELTSEKVKVVFERDRLEKLLAEIEEERSTLENIKSDTEVEKKALALARTWAEEEAKKARAHAKVLEEARKRWETQGIEVHVDKELSDDNIPVPSWQFNGEKFELEQRQPKAPMHEILIKADEYKGRSVQFLRQALDMSNQKLSIVQERILASMREIVRKGEEVQRNTFFVVRSKAGEVRGAAASMASGISTLVSENTHKFADGCKGGAEKLAQIFK